MNELDKALAPKSDQLNADDLLGTERTVVVTKVKVIQGEQPVVINFEGDEGRPYKPCKTMGRVLRHVWKKDYEAWAGNSMTLFCDPEVTWGGIKQGGIRISHVSGISRAVTIPVTKSRGIKKPYTVKPLESAKPVEMAEDDYLDILGDIQTSDSKEALIKLNIAQYKDKLSSEQSTNLRDAYKSQLEQFKNEESPI